MLRLIQMSFNTKVMGIMNRRCFLQLLPAPLFAARELRCDVAVIGGGVGGCAAALAAIRNGMSVILTEETDWVGGQLTSQAVPPDEHPWIEMFGGTQLYRTYRNRVREYYRANYPLTELARSREHLNPGGGSVSRLTHEPRVSVAVLESMLAPHVSAGRLTVLLEHKPVAADSSGDQVRSVTVRGRSGDRVIHARYILDATEQGDLLPLTKTEYVTGFESRKQTGELHAPENAQPNNIQSFTACFAIEYLKDQDHTIDKPEEYTFWRDYIPKLQPAWPGKLLSWDTTHPITLEKRAMAFNPERAEGLWLYRRIATSQHVTNGAEISLVNWPQNDYWLGNLHEVSEEEAARHLRRAKQLSLSLLYWMQTEAGWKGLRLRPDIVDTQDGLAKYPYIRESRRIQAEFTVLEQHVGAQARGTTQAEEFKDSVGVGSYRIDLHPSSGGNNYIDVSSLPFQIPLGALIPKRVDNLIPACKNLGVTHITNGCYRLHPVEWNIGESAGALASHALNTKATPRQLRNDPKRLAEFQKLLQAQGVEIAWPRLTAR
jgi:hypothetical protein